MCFCSRILQLLHPPFSEKVGYLQGKVPCPSLRSRQPGAGNFSTPEFQHCAVLGREPPRDSRQIFFRPDDFLQRGGRLHHRAKKKMNDVPKNWGTVSTYLAIFALYKSYFLLNTVYSNRNNLATSPPLLWELSWLTNFVGNLGTRQNP